ncbi:hypothetical protein SprV_0802625200 [Sparganum proliferum]
MPTLRPRDEVPSTPHDVSEAKRGHPSIVEENRFAGQLDKCFPATTSAPVNGQRCLIYLDDVIVFGKTIAQHNDNLRAVLLALREAGLTLNPQKCQFLREKVNYLGHEVSPSGIKVSAEKAGAILT